MARLTKLPVQIKIENIQHTYIFVYVIHDVTNDLNLIIPAIKLLDNKICVNNAVS